MPVKCGCYTDRKWTASGKEGEERVENAESGPSSVGSMAQQFFNDLKGGSIPKKFEEGRPSLFTLKDLKWDRRTKHVV